MLSNLSQTETLAIKVQLNAEYDSLARLGKDSLKAKVKLSRRVCDLRECNKDMLVTMILQDRHGRRKLAIAFG